MNLIEDTKREEGFRGRPYKDHLGFDTIGYGTKLPLSEHEATLLLEFRMKKTKKDLLNNLHFLTIEHDAWGVLYAMAYQMGVNGVMGFKKMIRSLRIQDYKEAANQMLDSKWASPSQTPERANRLADIMRNL